MSGPEKIECIYASLDSIRILVSLIEDTSSYLEFIDDIKQVKLAQECLQYVLEGIAGQLKNISKAADNTKEKKRSQQVHAKLVRETRMQEKNRQMEMQRLVASRPRQMLLSSLKHVKAMLAAKSTLQHRSRRVRPARPSLLPCSLEKGQNQKQLMAT